MLDPRLPVSRQDPREFWDPWYYLQHMTVKPAIGPPVKWQPWSHLRIMTYAFLRVYAEQKWLVHLKARREGSTALCVGVGYQNAAHRAGCTTALLGYKQKSAESMAQVAGRYHKYEPPAWRPARRKGLKRELAFDALDSSIVVAGVKDDEPFRGEGVQFLLANELSSWEEGKSQDAWIAARSAVAEDGGILVVDSTGRFRGDPMHQVWLEAAEPGSPWLRVFIPWTAIERYAREPAPGWQPHPLVEEYRKTHDITDAQAYWMHTVGLPRAKYNLPNFMAEYPYTADEPFLVTGESIFDALVLTARLREIDGGSGVLAELTEAVEYEPPNPRHRFLIACDPASSFSERDFFGVEVLNINECAQAFEYFGHMTAYAMANLLIQLSDRYGKATIYVEANGVGESVIAFLIAMGAGDRLFWRRDPYGGARPKPGWWSSTGAKAQALGWLQDLIRDGTILLRSQRAISQLLGYRGGWETGRKYDRSARDAEGGHFDLVAALAMCAWAYMDTIQTTGIRPSDQANEDALLADFVNRLERASSGSTALSPLTSVTPWGTHR